MKQTDSAPLYYRRPAFVRLLALGALAGTALAWLGCGDGGDVSVARAVSIYSDDAVKVVTRLDDGPEPAVNWNRRNELFNPKARIQIEVRAKGGYSIDDLLEQARQTEGQKIEMCLVLAGTLDVMLSEDVMDYQSIVGKFGELLDTLRERKVPTVLCEMLPLIEEIERPTAKIAPAELNKLIRQVNAGLHGLALEKAAAFVFAHRVFAPRVSNRADSLILNQLNYGSENGIQPTPEGMRLLGQLFAQALHKAGYRGGRVLVLGDSIIDNQALSNPNERIAFLIPKYLEIELAVP